MKLASERIFFGAKKLSHSIMTLPNYVYDVTYCRPRHNTVNIKTSDGGVTPSECEKVVKYQITPDKDICIDKLRKLKPKSCCLEIITPGDI